MHVEIIFKVGNSNPAKHNPRTNWADGHPINAMPRGLRVEPNDFNSWMVNDVKPPGWGSIPKLKRREMQFHMLRRRAYLAPGMTAPEKIIAERKRRTFEGPGFDWPAWLIAQRDGSNAKQRDGRTDWSTDDIEALMVADMDAQILSYQQTVDRIATLGFDSNWGFLDLTVHAVVHADLTFRQYTNIIESPIDLTNDPFRPRRRWAQRAHRVAYKALLSGQSLADVLDPTVYVPCDRAVTLFTAAQLTTEDPEPA